MMLWTTDFILFPIRSEEKLGSKIPGGFLRNFTLSYSNFSFTFRLNKLWKSLEKHLRVLPSLFDTKVHKVTELMMMARGAMSKLNFPRFVSLYPKRILVWGSVSLRVASDKAREIQFGHSPSCHHHQFCHFMNFRNKIIKIQKFEI